MKKLLAIAALIAAVVFTGCDKDDDATYSGSIVGSWELIDSYSYEDGSICDYYKCTVTFSSNGEFSFVDEYTEYNRDGSISYQDVDEEYATYTYSNGVLTLKYEDGDSSSGYVEVSGDYLIITDDSGYKVAYTRVK